MSVKAVNSMLSSFPKHWKVVPFEEAFSDATGGNAKIKQSDYQKIGAIPVIDQGQEYVAGYIDNSNLCCRVQLPVVLFGDHTKIFKFVSAPFALGADGVKVLLPSSEVDAKFGFYFFRQLKLPDNTGYSRHYKYLKEAFIPLPSLPEQRRIAAILDKADAIRRKRQESIRLMEAFLRSVFLDMFGDPVTNPKGWKTVLMERIIVEGPQNGLYKHESDYGSGTPIVRIDSFYDGSITGIDRLKRVRLDQQTIHKYQLHVNDILVNRVNSRKFLGKSAIVQKLNETTVFESNMMRIKVDTDRIWPEYLVSLLQHPYIKKQIDGRAKDAVNQSSINQDDVKSFELRVPPVALQKKFTKAKAKVNMMRFQMNDVSMVDRDLFNSLVQRAFRGEL